MTSYTYRPVQLATNLTVYAITFNGVDILPGNYFYSKKVVARKCVLLNKQRRQRIKNIATLRNVIALGRTAMRLYRKNRRRVITDFDRFCKEYQFTPVTNFRNKSIKPTDPTGIKPGMKNANWDGGDYSK
jgi:hypothetical protein